MFRQYQTHCRCSLFSTTSTPLIHFRSPQPVSQPLPQLKSKKSLKYRSSVPQKGQSHTTIIKKLPNDSAPNIKQVDTQLYSKPFNSQQPTKKSVGQHCIDKVLFNRWQLKKVQVDSKGKHREALRIRESDKGPVMKGPGLRMGSPLPTIEPNLPTVKSTITFNYESSHQPLPLLFLKREGNSTKYSATTLVTLTNSMNSQQSKRQEPKQLRALISQQPIGYGGQTEDQAGISSHKNDAVHRPLEPRLTTSYYTRSRLDQILNEKMQTESIYDETDLSRDDSSIQSSKVLISCKKLMSGRNGKLEKSGQAQLFNYDPTVKSMAFGTVCTDKDIENCYFEGIINK